VWRTVAVVVGIAAHLAVGFFYLVAGLVVPWPALLLFWAFWIFLLVMAVRHRDRPGWVLATPVVAAVALLAAVSLGDALLGWTA
jgi:hypothetical protein